MSQPGLIYRLEFKNVEGFTIRTNIWPTDIIIDDADTPEIIELKGGDNPVIISASNNDEDKFTPIRSKSAKIKFRTDTSNGLDSSVFSQGADNLWRCDIILQDTPSYIFRGYLMMADNQQPFQPDPQYVTLTATDHLAALKEAALKDFDGVNPIGKYRVASLIASCLKITGLDLTIFVVNNLRAGGARFTVATTFTNPHTITVPDTKMFYPGQRVVFSSTVSNNTSTFVKSVDSPTQITVLGTMVNEVAPAAVILDYNSQFHWYDVVYLDAKTFETKIGECEDCYSVLSKILGEDCYITQWLGNWWIFRTDEMEDNPVYVAEFDSSGTYVSTAAGTQYDKSIGRNPTLQDFQFANADTLLRFVRPHQFARETFNYQSPLEVPCNIDFARGSVVDDVPPEKTYNLDCWTKRRGLPGAYNTPITITDLIHRLFNANDYETDRFISITPQTGHSGFSSTDDEYIESEAIPMNIKDKAEMSIQWRLDSNIASSSATLRLFRAILAGDDGSYWILGEATVGDGTPVWYDTAGWTANTAKGGTGVVFGTQDETEWQTINWNVPPLPVGGDLYIWIGNAYQNAAVPSGTVISYANLRFDYIPLINGSYQRYTGQASKVTRTLPDGYIANRDKEVFVSDSPTKIYKGGPFLFVNGKYILFPNWFAAAPQGNSYPPTIDYLHPHSYIQAFSVWNQYKGYNAPVTNRGIGINIFEGNVKGLTDNWPDLLHRYTLTDTNPQTDDRYFILISMEQNWKTCIWKGTWIEVYNRVILKSYDEPFDFRYITDRIQGHHDIERAVPNG